MSAPTSRPARHTDDATFPPGPAGWSWAVAVLDVTGAAATGPRPSAAWSFFTAVLQRSLHPPLATANVSMIEPLFIDHLLDSSR
jgi:hypothetical protein